MGAVVGGGRCPGVAKWLPIAHKLKSSSRIIRHQKIIGGFVQRPLIFSHLGLSAQLTGPPGKEVGNGDWV